MLNIVLFEPEIPPNTGNIIRLASNTGCCLHLIRPLGFTLEEKQLRRAGLDYHELSELRVHESWESFVRTCMPQRMLALSTKGSVRYSAMRYEANDYLVFGPESRGLPDELRTSSQFHAVLTLPMKAPSRSLNLANTVAVVVYEAWRQLNFAGAD